MFAGRTAVGKPDTKLLTPSAPVLLTLFVLVLSLFAKAGAESQDKPAPYVISQEVNLVALPVVVRPAGPFRIRTASIDLSRSRGRAPADNHPVSQ
jgi:hypothetical protein